MRERDISEREKMREEVRKRGEKERKGKRKKESPDLSQTGLVKPRLISHGPP